MSLDIVTFTLGPLENNTYLVVDRQSGEAAVIDPAMGSQSVLDAIAAHGRHLRFIWLTHAHFDHIAGVALVAASGNPPLPVSLHALDLPLYRTQGGARAFGFHIEAGPEPTVSLTHGQRLVLGDSALEVRFTPGHTPGHVVFYAPSESAVFCGDLIFRGSVGRTDLPGANHHQLIDSVQAQILTLPAQTRLLSGHGPETTVADEINNNPFL